MPDAPRAIFSAAAVGFPRAARSTYLDTPMGFSGATTVGAWFAK